MAEGCIGKKQDFECAGYDSKLRLIVSLQSWSWGLWSTPSLPLLSDPLWPKVVVPVTVPSVGQVELFNHLFRIIFMLFETI